MPNRSLVKAPFVIGVAALPSSPATPVELAIYEGESEADRLVSISLVDMGYSAGPVPAPIVWPWALVANGVLYSNATDFIVGYQSTLPPNYIAAFDQNGYNVLVSHPFDKLPPINIPVQAAPILTVGIPLVSVAGGAPIAHPIDYDQWNFPGSATTNNTDLVAQVNASGILGASKVALAVVNDGGFAELTVTYPSFVSAPPANVQLDPQTLPTIPFLMAGLPVTAATSTIGAQSVFYPVGSTTSFTGSVQLAAAIVAATSADVCTIRSIGGFLYAEGDFASEVAINVDPRIQTVSYGFTGADVVPIVPTWAKSVVIKAWAAGGLLGDLAAGTQTRSHPTFVSCRATPGQVGLLRVGRAGALSGTKYGAGWLSPGARYQRIGSGSGVYTPGGGNLICLAGPVKREIILYRASGNLTTGEAFTITKNFTGINQTEGTSTSYASDSAQLSNIYGDYLEFSDPSSPLTERSMQINFATPVAMRKLAFMLRDPDYITNAKLTVSGGTGTTANFSVVNNYRGTAGDATIGYNPATGAITKLANVASSRAIIISSDSPLTCTQIKFDWTDGATLETLWVGFGEQLAQDDLLPDTGYFVTTSFIDGGVGVGGPYASGDADRVGVDAGGGALHGQIVLKWSGAPP
jgi:hypothetical protein